MDRADVSRVIVTAWRAPEKHIRPNFLMMLAMVFFVILADFFDVGSECLLNAYDNCGACQKAKECPGKITHATHANFNAQVEHRLSSTQKQAAFVSGFTQA